MSNILELAKRNDSSFDDAFSAAIADPAKAGEAIGVLAFLAGHDRAEQAEMLAWAWLSDFRQSHTPAESLDLARRLLQATPASAQIRDDLVELYKAALPGRADLADWLNATGLAGGKISPQRALRAMDLALTAQPGRHLVDRTSHHQSDLHQHRIAAIVSLDAAGGALTVRPQRGAEQTLEILRAADDYMLADADDFRLLLHTDPARLKELLSDDPLAVLVSIIRASGGQIDTDAVKDALADDRVMSNAEYSKWWSRARTAAKKSPHVRIEGRSPTMLIYDPVGTSLEADTLATLAKTWEPAARLAVVEGYVRTKAGDKLAPDEGFLAEIGKRIEKWLSLPGVNLADALVAHRLAEMGAAARPEDAALARRMLAEAGDIVQRIIALDAPLWPDALTLLQPARPVGPAGPGPDDWQAAYLQLLPHAPAEMADVIAAALLDAGQADRLNAEIMAIAESPLEALDGLAWLWIGPARAADLQLPRPKELLDQLLWLAKQAETIAMTDHKFARAIRATVRGALSARGYARLRDL
ncbi:MAG: hypothetical protein PHU85_18760, partial [Phycisphaerae bacterium]|nr:hypothetical protein [Phycisphaerae bacterium]